MRLKYIFKNSFYSMISQFALLILGFFSQRAMNLYIGKELVGMNGVISNVIAMLSVTELGVSTAIVFYLYSAIAQKDEDRIAALMNLYRKAYYIFAAVITGLGLILLPFIHLFMSESSYTVGYIRILYSIWLIRTVLSYLLSYKKSLLIADQKEYVVSIVTLILNIINYSTIILLVTFTQRYLPALILNVVVEVVLNLWISWYVDRKYPFLRVKRKEKVEGSILKKIITDLKHIFVSRISLKILNCTDNLIISSGISVVTAGLYMNYTLITQSVSNVLIILSNTIQPTIGNLFTEKDYEKDYQTLRQLTFLFFCLATVAAVGLLSLITPFVTDFWLGKEYEMSASVVLMCITVCVTQVLGLPLTIILGVSGLFKQERNLSVLTAIVNLAASLILIRYIGLAGVLLGTFLAYAIQIVYRVIVFFRQYLHRGCGRYVCDLLEYIGLILGETWLLCRFIRFIYHPGHLLSFMACFLLCCIIPLALNAVLYSRSWRFRSMRKLVKSFMGMRGGEANE